MHLDYVFVVRDCISNIVPKFAISNFELYRNRKLNPVRKMTEHEVLRLLPQPRNAKVRVSQTAFIPCASVCNTIWPNWAQRDEFFLIPFIYLAQNDFSSKKQVDT